MKKSLSTALIISAFTLPVLAVPAAGMITGPDCSNIEVKVKQLNGNHWRAKAYLNGKLCGQADSGNKNQAIELAKMDCGCE